MKISAIFLAGLILVGTLASCAGSPTEKGTSTPRPPSPTATYRPFTPTPSATSRPIRYPTSPPPTPSLSNVVDVPGGGFTFRPLQGYEVKVDGSAAYVSSANGDRTFVLSAGPVDRAAPFELLLLGFTEWINSQEDSRLSTAEPSIASTGPILGISVEINGKSEGERVRGEVSISKPRPDLAFIAYSIVSVEEDPTEWQQIGQYQLRAMLSAVQFRGITLTQDGCPASDILDFGLRPTAPIPIGGGRVGGLLFEPFFMSSLRGPEGEEISFRFIDTFEPELRDLDTYEITYPGLTEPIALYFDPYSFASPLVPAGLRCGPDFPFSLPIIPTPIPGA